MNKYDAYTSPLAERNASAEMLRIWSPRHKFQTWRRIWLAVAEAQAEMGLPVTAEQVEEIRAHGPRCTSGGCGHKILIGGSKRRTPRRAERGSRRCHLRGCYP